MDKILLLYTLLGSTAIAAGCGTLNQWLETDTDSLMIRTQKRPLPAGRVTGQNAFWFGMILSIVGVGLLEFKTNDLTALLGLSALVSYVVLYTPLKKDNVPLHRGGGYSRRDSSGDGMGGGSKSDWARRLDSFRDSFLLADAACFNNCMDV